MPKRSRKLPRDPNQRAFDVVQIATGEAEEEEESKKNPHAVALGRLGGIKGGKARARRMTAEERKRTARAAANARWAASKK